MRLLDQGANVNDLGSSFYWYLSCLYLMDPMPLFIFSSEVLTSTLSGEFKVIPLFKRLLKPDTTVSLISSLATVQRSSMLRGLIVTPRSRQLQGVDTRPVFVALNTVRMWMQ